MTRHSFPEAQHNPHFVVESNLAEAGYNTLLSRYTAAADSIIGAVVKSPMVVSHLPSKDAEYRKALLWRMDGNVLDNTFDFALQTVATVYAGPEASRPQTITDTRYKASKEWKYRAGDFGSQGFYGLSLEARTVPLVQMAHGETIYHARGHAKFLAHFLDGNVRFKADPEAGESETFLPLRPFEAVHETARGNFLATHAAEIVPPAAREAFADAADTDNRSMQHSHGSSLAYREKSPRIADGSRRTRRLARTLYAAGTDALHGGLLAELLDPGIAAVAELALSDHNTYHIERVRQTDKKTLLNRLGWIGAHASAIQANASARLGTDVDGFRRALTQELAVVEPDVIRIEALRSRMEAPHTIAMEPPDWSVHPK